MITPGTMACMPEPSPELIDDLVKTIGLSPSRVGIVRITYQHGHVTAGQLMEQLGIARSTLTHHIQPLVDAGILIAEADPSRAGTASGYNRILWRVDQDALQQLLRNVTHALTGE